MAVSISRIPDCAVMSLTAPARQSGNHIMQSTWDIPSWATDDDNSARGTGFITVSKIVTDFGSKQQDFTRTREIGISSRQLSYDLSNYTEDNGYTFTRQSFYPFTQRRLKCTTVSARLVNRYGVGAERSITRWFQAPRKPVITAWEQDAETGDVSCTITTNAGADYQERYDTRYQVYVYDSRTKTSTVTDSTTVATSFTITRDVPSRMQLAYGEFVRVKVIAWARGYRGDSEKTERIIYVGWPYQPTITRLEITSKLSTAKVTALVKLSPTTNHPVTGCKLQKLVNVPYATAAEIPGNALWEDTGSVDDGNCTALATTVAELLPEAGNYTWVRVMSWNGIESIFHRYSAPVRATKLETPLVTASDDRCAILSITPDRTGTSATIVVGWRESPANTGTELSWSDSPSAWSSNDPPDTAEYTTEDVTPQSSFWPHTGTYVLTGLTPGTTYYIRARRYLESQSADTTYTGYTETSSFTAQSAADDSVAILRVTPINGGTTAAVVVGFIENSYNTGTEVSWADDCRAWYFTDQPQTFDFTWKDSPSQSSYWTNTATVYINGLTPGKTYYVRARRYLEANGAKTYSAYSKFGNATMTSDSAENDKCGIVSVETNDDGKSVTIVVGWTEDSLNDGTELSWAKKYTAWRSSSQPSTLKATWSDETSQSSSWKKTQTITVEGLETGTLYYFRARRYLGDTFTSYSDFASVIPSAKPSGVELSAPTFAIDGESMPLSWAYDEAPMQTAWEVITGYPIAYTETLPDGTVVTKYRIRQSDLKVIARGSDNMLACVLPGWRTRNLSTLPVAVRVSTGGEFVTSEAQIVKIASAPNLSTTVSGTLTAQPISISATCNVSAQLSVVVRAQGVSVDEPDKTRIQAAGDAIWSAFVTPSWTYSNGSYSCTVTAPSGLDFVDGADYTVIVKAIDPDTGLESDESSNSVTVAWDDKASAPSSVITLVPSDVTDGGHRTRSVEISLAEPTEAVGTDVYDVYRVTDDGAYLAIEGVALDAVVVDEYAPFGGRYRIATRTVDGDVTWNDYSYDLTGDDLRIDFGSQYVELPYNLNISDDYQKGFESRKHLDGSVEGYWTDGVERMGALSTSLMIVQDGAELDALRALARYNGSCYVRTPDGCAYEANVTVTGLDRSIGMGRFAVNVDAVEIGSSGLYNATLAGE